MLTMFADKARVAGVDTELQIWDGMIHRISDVFGNPRSASGHRLGREIFARHLHITAERAPQ